MLTLGREARPHHVITEATPGATLAGFRMADVRFDDGAVRSVPMRIVFIHADEPAYLFELAGIGAA